MRLRTTTPLLAALAVVLTTSVGRAEPIDTTRVPGDSNWVVHVDFDAARKSTVAERLRANEKAHEKIVKGFEWIENRYGIARGDLHGLTMYGATYAENRGIALLSADYEPKKVERVIQDEPGYESTRFGEYTLHSWSARDDHGHAEEHVDEAVTNAEETIDEADVQPEREGRRAASTKDRNGKPTETSPGTQERPGDRGDGDKVLSADPEGDDEPHRVTAVFLKGMIVMGSPESLVRATLERKASDDPNPAAGTVLGADVPAGAIVFGTARNLADLGDRVPDLRIVEETERLTLAAGENDDQLFAQFQVEIGDEAIATDVRDVAEGLRAFTRLAVREARARGDELPIDEEFLELLSLDVQQQGGNVSIRWHADAEQFVNATAEVLEKLAPRMGKGKVDVEEAREVKSGDIELPPTSNESSTRTRDREETVDPKDD